MRARSLAWPLCVLALACIFTGAILQEITGGDGDGDLPERVGLLIAFFSFPILGAVIASRQERNAIGWLFIAMGLSVGVLLIATEYGNWAFVIDPHRGREGSSRRGSSSGSGIPGSDSSR